VLKNIILVIIWPVKTATSIVLQSVHNTKVHTTVDESSKHRDLEVFGVCREYGSRLKATLSSSLSGSIAIRSAGFVDLLQLVILQIQMAYKNSARLLKWITLKYTLWLFQYISTCTTLRSQTVTDQKTISYKIHNLQIAKSHKWTMITAKCKLITWMQSPTTTHHNGELNN